MEAIKIMYEAEEAGRKAGLRALPKPMAVLDGAKTYIISEGVCGFATVKIKANDSTTRKFLAELKKAKLVQGINEFTNAPWAKNSYGGGYRYWVSGFGQSYERKKAFAQAFAKVLRDHGINAWAEARLD